jgi:hypothetical protein
MLVNPPATAAFTWSANGRCRIGAGQNTKSIGFKFTSYLLDENKYTDALDISESVPKPFLLDFGGGLVAMFYAGYHQAVQDTQAPFRATNPSHPPPIGLSTCTRSDARPIATTTSAGRLSAKSTCPARTRFFVGSFHCHSTRSAVLLEL